MFKKSNVLGFVSSLFVVLITGVVFGAESEAVRADLPERAKMGLAIGAGIGMGLAAFGGGLGQGRAIGSAMEGIARNPGADKKIFTPMIIGLVFIEVMVILTFVITSGLSAKI